MVKILTRGDAILDKIWTNMTELYTDPVSISELRKSDHNMILLQPMVHTGHDTGSVTRVTIKSMGVNIGVRANIHLGGRPIFARMDSVGGG